MLITLLKFVGALIGALIAIAFVLAIPTRSASRRIERDWPRGVPDARFQGGGTWKAPGVIAGRAAWPLVELDIHQQGIVIRPFKRWAATVVPQIELEWSDIACVQRRPTGVLILRSDIPNASVLFQLNKTAVLDLLSHFPLEIR